MKALTFFLLLLVSFLKTASAESYTVKVGAILPLTGDLAYVGQDIREGVELALEERGNQQPKIEVIWEDGKFAPRESVSAAQKLISNDKVDLIISLWDTADVIAPVAEKAQVIQLSIRWNPDVAARNKYTFTFESTYPTYYADIVKLIKRQNFKTAVFFHEETQAGIRERESFITSAKAAGIEVLGVESFQTGESDFRTSISRLLAKNPDIFVNEGFPPASEIFLKQLKTLRPNISHIGFYEVISDKSLIEGQPFVSQLGFTPEFSAKFEAKYGHPYKIRAPHGYELIRMISWAYSSSLNGEKPTIDWIHSKLTSLKDFDGVLGKLSVNATRNIEHPNTFKIVKNGQVEPY
jgi:branched-chain amino acid transport system substrate-binding protein